MNYVHLMTSLNYRKTMIFMSHQIRIDNCTLELLVGTREFWDLRVQELIRCVCAKSDNGFARISAHPLLEPY